MGLKATVVAGGIGREEAGEAGADGFVEVVGDERVAQPDTAELVGAVSSWVGGQLTYVPGSSGPTDGAVDTMLKRRGVCRDYAHLVIALLRSLDVPARLCAVYAPAESPKFGSSGVFPQETHGQYGHLVPVGWRIAVCRRDEVSRWRRADRGGAGSP